MTARHGSVITLTAAVALIGGYAIAQSGLTVSVSGRLASSDVIEQDGKVYVPIMDVAKAFNRSVVRNEKGYDLVPITSTQSVVASGPTTVNGLNGEIGAVLSNRQVTIQVLRVVRGDTYVSAITGKTFDAEPDSELVAVICRMRNTLKKPRQYDLGYFKGGDTALIDATGKSFVPKAWDRKEPIARLQAGAGVDFAVIFAVPKGTPLNDFVYTVRPNDFDRTMRQDNFHVSLAIKKDTESTTQ
ncbi:MAG: hypothetical protein H8F28_15910 [Fibrella sp.]|nr:hypothetical protein [Armatimonadota bacterium]